MNLRAAKWIDRVAGAMLARGLSTADALASLAGEPPALDDVKGILVIKFWGLGNWALLRPVVRDVAARWPRARTTLVTLEANRPLVAGLADDVVFLSTSGYRALAGDLVRAVRRVRAAAPTVSLDFEQFSSAGTLLARMAGVPQRIGFASTYPSRDSLLTVRVPFRRDCHASRSFRDLAEAAGVEHGPYVAGSLEPSERGRAEVRALLGGDGRDDVVVIHPGSGDNFPGRRWSEAGFSALARVASERRALRPVVTGGRSETELCRRVADLAGPLAVDASGRLSVEGLVALIDRCAAVASNDTGPVHLASALDRPVLALYGPNTPVLYGPLSPGSVALHKALPCSPCLTTENYRSSRCRLHVCMASISVGEAARAFDRVIDAGLRTSAAGARA